MQRSSKNIVTSLIKKIKDHLSVTDTMITEMVDEAMPLDWEENSIEDQDNSTDQFHHKEALPDHINLSINNDENDKEETNFLQLYSDTEQTVYKSHLCT